jgi:methylglutaconyl-CoA hydratase
MAETAGRSVVVRREGAVARVVLSRPDRRNAFDDEVVGSLLDAFAALATDETVRVVVLEGEGPVFCAGADLEWMKSMAVATVEQNLASATRMAELFEAIHRAPQAVVALVRGAALGGGAGLVAAADLAVASEGTVLGFTEARLGILPSVISPYVLLRIGPGAARRWFVTGSRMDAREAHRIGLVHEVVPEAELDAAVRRLAFEVLQCAPGAVAGCKDLVDEVWSGLAVAGTLEDGFGAIREYTAERIAEARVSAEGQEGLRAFLEKRKPRWAQ